MRRIGIWFSAGALAFSAGCAELDVVNPNEPDIDRALSTPADVQQLAVSSVNTWYLISTEVDPWMMLSVTADALTSNFGNFGMRFNNEEPRIPYENNSAGGDRFTAQWPWQQYYIALGAANNALRAMDAGVEVPERYRHLALFTQAASLSLLGLLFDQSFIVDENFPITSEGAIDPATGELVWLSPYQDVVAVARTKLDALIAATAGAGHSYTSAELPLHEMVLTSARLNRIANTMAAALLRYSPRSSNDPNIPMTQQRWADILAYAENGIGEGNAGAPFDFTVVGDFSSWYSLIAYYGNEPSWTRMDMRMVNLLDPSKPDRFGVAHVEALPSQRTTLTEFVSQDARASNCRDSLTSAGALLWRVCGDFLFHQTVIGDRGRGIWMMSPYSHGRYIHHARTSTTRGEGPVPYILAAENDLLRAEAIIMLGGDKSVAAGLINNTRVGRGGLPAASGGDADATLLGYIEYERDIELFNTNAWEHFRRRVIDALQPGTAFQLPIPALELETLALPIYTCGGPGNEMCNPQFSVRTAASRFMTAPAVSSRRPTTRGGQRF